MKILSTICGSLTFGIALGSALYFWIGSHISEPVGLIRWAQDWAFIIGVYFGMNPHQPKSIVMWLVLTSSLSIFAFLALCFWKIVRKEMGRF